MGWMLYDIPKGFKAPPIDSISVGGEWKSGQPVNKVVCGSCTMTIAEHQAQTRIDESLPILLESRRQRASKAQ